MKSGYARFDCRICGETVYSPIVEKANGGSGENLLELTCFNGHTDQYENREVALVDSKPAGKLKARYASAVGG